MVGGGPAGVAGALKGAYLGKRVLLVDKPKAAPAGGGLDPFFGGPTGLFSKALRDTAKHLDIATLRAMGVSDAVIWAAVGLSGLVVCLCAAIACLICRHIALKRTSAQYRQKLAQYRAEARLASMDELESMTELETMMMEDGGNDEGGGVLTGVVHTVEKAT